MTKNKCLVLCCLCSLILTLSSCSRLPQNSNRIASFTIRNGESTELGRIAGKQLAGHQDKSGIIILDNGLDAFVSRAVLAEKAERSIDVQYYMYHQDTVGKLLLQSLVKAAERGVRVRLLIDDMYGEEADAVWQAVDSHPNMEVRLFNPFVRGTSKTLQFLTRFSDVNYRMHSKSFTVDNQATILGGRNIGDEYFNANPDLFFADIDVLAIGPVVPDVSKAFDEYWNSPSAYPVSTLSDAVYPGQLDGLKTDLDQFSRQEAASQYLAVVKNSELARNIRAHNIAFQWADAQILHDSSEKKEKNRNWQADLLISKLWPHMKAAENELLIVSPYFVPGEKGADALCELSKKGVSIQILTNSLASNDVAAVHAGYSAYRKQLLKAGIKLYELDEGINNKIQQKMSWLPGLSKSSLHAKTMVIDGRKMFIGSMNLDLRSLHANNEIGLLFVNETVAGNSAEFFKKNIDKLAFEVFLSDNGSLRWKRMTNNSATILEDEPYVGLWTKFLVWVAGVLPIEPML